MVRTDDVLRLLLVESSLTEADQVITQLRQAGHAVRATRHDTAEGIEQALTTNSWDLVLCRSDLEFVTAEEVLKLIRTVGRDVPCIILAEDPGQLEDLYDLGAQDIILTSDKKRLSFSVTRELESLFVRRLSRRNERALRESEKRAQLLLQTSRDAVAYVHEGMYIYVNHSYLTLFDVEEEEDVAGLSILDMVVSDDHAKFKTSYRQFSEKTGSGSQTVAVLCKKSDGEEFPVTVEFSKAEVEGEDCTQLVVREALVASETLTLIEPETEVSTLREVDSLTNLYNRVRFMEELNKAVARADEGHQVSELLYIVIDDFQSIKEQIGLSASDVVLKGVADLLKERLEDSELLARYSDQVFTIIVNSGDDKHVDDRAEVYRKTIDDYISTVNGKMFNLECSVGISRITENLASPLVGLDRADKACTQAQRAGGNRVARYQPSVSDNSMVSSDSNHDEDVYWQEQIQEALQEDSFSLFFQPIVSLHGAEQQIYDVLIRMKDADGELVEASNFIKHIYNSELMVGIDEWVVPQALKQLAEHRREYPKTRFFLKLSKQTLNKPDVIDWLKSTLAEHSMEGNSLVLEISETVALDNLEQAKNIVTELKELGCEFCLEHFGSGLDFSHSLNMLDVDYLKINGDFVENMSKDAENQAAVKSIIDMSKQAGKMTIAEFVSDANSLALLWRLGVDYALGYYIQEPSADLDYNFDEDSM